MADDATATLDSMPADIRREYGNILERMTANRILYPDPVMADGWVESAERQLNMPARYIGGLFETDQQAVRNQIVRNLVEAAYAERKQRNPAEDDQTAWHLAVRRGVEGFLDYERAKRADLDRGAADAWGAFDAYMPSALAGREEILASADWPALVARNHDNQRVLFVANADREAATDRAASDRARLEAATKIRGMSESALEASGAARAEQFESRETDPEGLESAALERTTTALATAHPSQAVFERFRAAAGIGPAATWAEVSADEALRKRLVDVAARQLLGEELTRIEAASPAKPAAVSDADFFAARRDWAARSVEACFTAGVRPDLPADADALGLASEGAIAPSPSTATTLPDGGGTQEPAAGVRETPTTYAHGANYDTEAAEVAAKLAAADNDADRFLRAVVDARRTPFDATARGRTQPRAMTAYGAFWLSEGLIARTPVEGATHSVEEVMASPKLQYEIARAHVGELLSQERVRSLDPSAQAEALATAYRFGVEALERDGARRGGDRWTAAVATPFGAELARLRTPSPVEVAATEQATARHAPPRVGRADTVTVKVSLPASVNLADPDTQAALYAEAVSAVSGEKDPERVARLVREFPPPSLGVSQKMELAQILSVNMTVRGDERQFTIGPKALEIAGLSADRINEIRRAATRLREPAHDAATETRAPQQGAAGKASEGDRAPAPAGTLSVGIHVTRSLALDESLGMS